MKAFIVMLITMLSFNGMAEIVVYEFTDQVKEQRFKHLTSILRCPKCQNQNLADSNSLISNDLKAIVYEKINAGESDQQILEFMKQRYGEFILYEPEMNQSNLLLWSGPFIFLIAFFGGFLVWFNRHKREVEND